MLGSQTPQAQLIAAPAAGAKEPSRSSASTPPESASTKKLCTTPGLVDLARPVDPRLYTRVMPRGYEEGPVADEAQRRIDAIERGESPDGRGAPATRAAVFGSTETDGPARFLGWADEVDAEELFESGRAWGISLRRIPR